MARDEDEIYVSAPLSFVGLAEAYVSPRVTTIMVNWVIFRATLGSFTRCPYRHSKRNRSEKTRRCLKNGETISRFYRTKIKRYS